MHQRQQTTSLLYSLLNWLLIAVVTVVPGLTLADSFHTRLHQKADNAFYTADIIAEMQFGKKVAARILGQETLHENTQLTRYINLIGKTLVLHSKRNELEFHFAVLNNPQANAYATPGGYIFITKGAIEAANNEAELAAILAHEIAHVTERHIVNQLNITGTEQAHIAGLVRFLGASGNTAQVTLTQSVDQAVSLLFETGYKIDDELEADFVAMILLAETGYDPLALKQYLLRLPEQADPMAKQPQTHPTNAQRFTQLNTLIETEKLQTLNFPQLRERFLKNTTLKR